MKNKIVAALCLAMLTVLLVAGVAAAESGAGTGKLTAQGEGLAAVRGSGTFALTGSGHLYIMDRAGDADIKVSGRGFKKELSNGAVAYMGFNGHAQITGTNVVVALKGRNIQLQATGTGKFLLRGEGTYHTEKTNGVWTEEGVTISLP